MSLAAVPDIPVQIIVPADDSNAAPILSAERRITPSWTIAQLKSKLEPVTGIPFTSQLLRARGIDGSWIVLEDDSRLVGDSRWALRRGSEVEVGGGC